jgi:SAM-dependent methyltransferase
MDLDEYRRQSRATWQTVAAGWEERREYMWESTRAVGDWMVAHLAPLPGQTILELAAGAGDTGFEVARMLGDAGQVICTDLSSQMVEVARRRAAELEVENVDFRVLDAENMDLPDESVDGVLCRWGYMLMADPGAALAETRRVLHPGGRVAFSVWAAPERNPWVMIPGRVLVERGLLPPPEPDAPGIFAMADPARIDQLVTGAGLKAPQIEEMSVRFRFEAFDEVWDYLRKVAGPIAMALARLPEEEVAEVRTAMEAAHEPVRAPGGGYELPGVCLNALTSRPRR